MSLTLTIREEEPVRLVHADGTTVTLRLTRSGVCGGRPRLNIDAPLSVSIRRDESPARTTEPS